MTTIKKNVINKEWQLLLNYEFSDEIEESFKKCDVENFWFTLFEYKNDEGELIFFNVADFALDAISIPNSNATPERTWSKMNLEKTNLRCRLQYVSLRAIMLSAQLIKDVGGFKLFIPTKEMITRMEHPIYTVTEKKKTKDEEKKHVEYLGRRINESIFVGALLEDRRYKKPFTELVEINDEINDKFLQDYLRGMLEQNGDGDNDDSNEGADDYCDELLDHYKDCADEYGEDDDDDFDEHNKSDDENNASDCSSVGDFDNDICENMLPIDNFLIFVPKIQPLNEHSYYTHPKRHDSINKKRKIPVKNDLDTPDKKIKLDSKNSSSINIEENPTQEDPTNHEFLSNNVDVAIESILVSVNKSISQRLLENELTKNIHQPINNSKSSQLISIENSNKFITQDDFMSDKKIVLAQPLSEKSSSSHLKSFKTDEIKNQQMLNLYFSRSSGDKKFHMQNGLLSEFSHYTVVSRYDKTK